MATDDLFEDWLFLARLDREDPAAADLRRDDTRGRQGLQRLAKALEDAPPGKVNYDRLPALPFSRFMNANLGAAEVAEAERLYLAVWERGGKGLTHVLGGLAQAIALARSPASIPFWLRLLDLSHPRDQGTAQRRDAALAALALLAIMDGDLAAEAALIDALGHPHEQVRAPAAYYLAALYREAGRQPPPAALVALQERAGDRAFAPHYQARMALRALGRPLPLAHPGHAYHMEVRLGRHPATRTIAIMSEQTLGDLHHAIQRAFGWDADHLYSFFLSGDERDKRYVIDCPDLDNSWSSGMVLQSEEAAADEAWVEDDLGDEELDDGPLDTFSAQIGALGLAPRHKFTYFFDYGDSHRFTVTVLSIEPYAAGPYPRVVASQGAAPLQYPLYEGEAGAAE